MTKRVYLFIAHGSREPDAQKGFERLLKNLTAQIGQHEVMGAYLTINAPSVPEAIHHAIQQGATEVVIVPLFFFDGTHHKHDIPTLLADMQLQHGDVDFQVMPPVASMEGFAEWISAKAAGRARGSRA